MFSRFSGRAPVLRRLLAAHVAASLAPAAFAQGILHIVPDLPGGVVFSQVRDATTVDGVVVGVGGTSTQSATTIDTAMVWTSTGGTVAIPNLVANPTAGTPVIASAITPDGQYIASRSRNVNPGGSRTAVRVTREGLSSLDLNSNPASTIPGVSFAVGLSDNGEVSYGYAANGNHAARYTATGPTATLLPFLNPGDQSSGIGPRGVSADGRVAVGTSYPGVFNSTGVRQGFIYEHGVGLSAIPLLPGGVWCEGVGVTALGVWALARGDSASHPNGEVFLYNRFTGEVRRLGTPQNIFSPGNIFGMSGDGSVIGVGFFDPRISGSSFGHFRNRHGWFHLTSAMAAAGIPASSITPFNYNNVVGISRDGTLVFGSRLDDQAGIAEGFIAQFPVGFLANFDPSPEPLADPALVGTWTLGEGLATNVLVFLQNGTYFHFAQADAEEISFGGATGFERGLITVSGEPSQMTFTTLYDTNGDIGLGDTNGAPFAEYSVVGDELSVFEAEETFTLARVPTSPTSFHGAWIFGDASMVDACLMLILLPDGTFYLAEDAPIDEDEPGDGIEVGTYTLDPETGLFSATVVTDTNGDYGLSDPPVGGFYLSLQDDGDTLEVDVRGEDVKVSFRRVAPGTDYFPLSKYSRWAAAQDWNGADPTPFADPDGDGLNNRLEFSLARQPLERGGPALGTPTVSTDENGTTITATLRRRIGAHQARFEAGQTLGRAGQFGDLGQGFLEVDESRRYTTADGVYEDVEATLRYAVPTNSAFLRLRVDN